MKFIYKIIFLLLVGFDCFFKSSPYLLVVQSQDDLPSW